MHHLFAAFYLETPKRVDLVLMHRKQPISPLPFPFPSAELRKTYCNALQPTYTNVKNGDAINLQYAKKKKNPYEFRNFRAVLTTSTCNFTITATEQVDR